MYLINDDEPDQFAPRLATIVRVDVEIEDKPGVVVRIEPPIENLVGGPLETAILVPRHRNVSGDDLRQGAKRHPLSVFVCRFVGEPDRLPPQLSKDDIKIVFWGLVSESLDFNRRR
jgi:hypothetical protein